MAAICVGLNELKPEPKILGVSILRWIVSYKMEIETSPCIHMDEFLLINLLLNCQLFLPDCLPYTFLKDISKFPVALSSQYHIGMLLISFLETFSYHNQPLFELTNRSRVTH